MKKIQIADMDAGVISAGCMRIAQMSDKDADSFVRGCLDAGVNFFDHADIYGRGACEDVFGKVLKKDKSLRNRMYIQSKCGIIPGKAYDFSYEHIIKSVEGSLKRLGIETLDCMLLHRPDTLVEPYEVAKAFTELKEQGKVRHFGVSNHNPLQVELLKTAISVPLVINQVQFSAAFTGIVDTGLYANTKFEQSIFHDGGILDYSRINGMTLQAWSPMQHGFIAGVFVGNDNFLELNKILNELGEKYNVAPETVAISFILRHPAKWQVVTGTTKLERIKTLCAATTFSLTREEWYAIYMANGTKIP